MAAVEDTEVIDEAAICGDCSDDENNRDDTSEAWVLSVEGNDKPVDAEFSRSTALVKSTQVHGILLKVDVIWVPRMCT